MSSVSSTNTQNVSRQNPRKDYLCAYVCRTIKHSWILMALGYIGLIIQRVLGNIVKVVVGPAAKEVHVHEELLASSCPFFQTALKEKQKRGQTRVIEMPGDDYDALELYVLWLYSDKKKIWSISSDNDASREYLKSQGETLLLARAIILAEKLQDVHFLNTVVNAIMERTKVFDEDGNRWFPGPPAVNTIWENTRQGSPVRRLLLDQYVWHGEKSWMKPTNEIEAFNADFLRALVMSMFGRPHEVPKILPCDVENNHLYHKKESRRRGEKRKGEEPESATTLENGVKKRRNESNFPGPSSPSKRELQLGTFSTKNLSRHLGEIPESPVQYLVVLHDWTTEVAPISSAAASGPMTQQVLAFLRPCFGFPCFPNQGIKPQTLHPALCMVY